MKFVFCDICGCDERVEEYIVTPMNFIKNRNDINIYKFDKFSCMSFELCTNCANKLNERYNKINESIYNCVTKETNFNKNRISKEIN